MKQKKRRGRQRQNEVLRGREQQKTLEEEQAEVECPTWLREVAALYISTMLEAVTGRTLLRMKIGKKKSGAPLPESLARKFPGKTATHISNMLAQANRMDPGDELELPELSDDERKWLRTHY